MHEAGVMPAWLRKDFDGRKLWVRPSGNWQPCPASSHRECRKAMERLDAAELHWAVCAVPGSFIIGDLRILVSVGVQRNHGSWLHVSYSYPDKLPTHDDTLKVRRMFLHHHLPAVSIWPRESEYVNIHPYCLHLWQRLDEPCVPDMRAEGNQI